MDRDDPLAEGETSSITGVDGMLSLAGVDRESEFFVVFARRDLGGDCGGVFLNESFLGNRTAGVAATESSYY